MVADALIYHPSVTHFNKFVATTVGRDKALRTVQYFSRFLAWYLLRANHSQSNVDLFARLKSNLGLVRKALRIGKFVEHFRAAATAADTVSMDTVLRFCAVGRQLGYAMYLSFDTATYLDAAGIRKSAWAKRAQREAYRAWAVGIAFSVVSGIYSLWRMNVEGQRAKVVQGTDAEKSLEGKRMLKDQRQVQQQLLSDLCDLTVPTSALGWVSLDDGIVGLAGTLSSLLALNSQWAKTA